MRKLQWLGEQRSSCRPQLPHQLLWNSEHPASVLPREQAVRSELLLDPSLDDDLSHFSGLHILERL